MTRRRTRRHPIPEYDQPEAPGDDYLWTPGYWAYAQDGRILLVPGAWVVGTICRRAVDPGLLGLFRRPLSLEPRLLGSTHRLLRRSGTTAAATMAMGMKAATGAAGASTTTLL